MSDSTTRRPRRHSAGDTILNLNNNNNNRRSFQDEFIEQEDKPPSYTEVIENDNYRSKKRRKRKWSFTALMKRITPKLISRSRKNNSSSNRSIRTVLSSRPTGDILDEYQQQDILHQLTAAATTTTIHNRYPPHCYRPYLTGQPSFFPNPIQQSRISESSTSNTINYRRGLRLRGGQRGRIHSSSTAEGEARRIASLDHIWVFRLLLRERYGEEGNDEGQEEAEEEEEEEEEEAVVWTTFDYDNQMKLMNEQESDKGIEIFDSHIRQGELPVLVLPKRQRGYFPMDSTGDAIVTLEVACLPNTKDTLFVMRHYSPS